ncbi:MAG TPA: helix-turn-helix transcriptional regulator [Candidatus Binataceae bacterium]|nr:helix-turn-helix transcriptional regulator [Candidatus Binataceae bacterium]
MSDEITFEKSSGNVFADLEVPNPDEALLKAEIGKRLVELIASKSLTQADAAELLNINQPTVSALLRGRLTEFSTDRLLRFAKTLGCDVTVEIREKPGQRSKARVKVATRVAS